MFTESEKAHDVKDTGESAVYHQTKAEENSGVSKHNSQHWAASSTKPSSLVKDPSKTMHICFKTSLKTKQNTTNTK